MDKKHAQTIYKMLSEAITPETPELMQFSPDNFSKNYKSFDAFASTLIDGVAMNMWQQKNLIAGKFDFINKPDFPLLEKKLSHISEVSLKSLKANYPTLFRGDVIFDDATAEIWFKGEYSEGDTNRYVITVILGGFSFEIISHNRCLFSLMVSDEENYDIHDDESWHKVRIVEGS